MHPFNKYLSSTYYLTTPLQYSIAWKIPWMEEPGGLQSMGSLELDMTERPDLPITWSTQVEGT